MWLMRNFYSREEKEQNVTQKRKMAAIRRDRIIDVIAFGEIRFSEILTHRILQFSSLRNAYIMH